MEKKDKKNKMSYKESLKRFLWADIIRIIAIYLVVQIHTSSLANTQNYHEFLSILWSKINVTSIPLFVMLSGSLLLGKKEKYTIFLRKRCIKVLIPWIVWTFIYMFYYLNSSHHNEIISNFFSKIESPINQWTNFFLNMFLSNLWFLPMIFSLYLLTPLLRITIKYINKSDKLYLILIWFISISLLPFLFNTQVFPNWEPNLPFTALQYSGYFILGYLIIEKKQILNFNPKFLLLIGLSPIIISLFPVEHKYIRELLMGYLDPGTVIFSAFIFYILYLYSNKIDKYTGKFPRKAITMISSASFGVYIIHSLVLELIKTDLIKFLQGYHLEFLLTFFIFSITTCLVLLLKKIPVLRIVVP